MAIRVFHRDAPGALLPLVSADARLVVWPGAGAWRANMNYVRIRPGEANVAHAHATSEDTIAILAGRGTVEDLTHGVEHEFGARQVVHIPPGIRHRVKADRGEWVESVGGPCPADVAGLRAAGLLGDARPPGGE